MKRLVIFDLDGTLLETIGDLGASCNALLRRYQLPEHTYDEYRTFVGNGVRKLVERALPESWRTPARIDALKEEFVSYYTAHIDDHSYCYEGIRALLEALVQRNVQLAVVSNKFHAGTVLLVERFFGDIPFVACFGQREGIPLKPDPAADMEVMRLAGVTPLETIHLGDTASDVQAAKSAGAMAVGVSWGFRTQEELLAAGADAVIHHPLELLNLVGES